MNEEEEKEPQESVAVTEESLAQRYGGSGENRYPTRMMKIEEIVQWDMEFGIIVGPAGYEHRLRCPYCSKRLLLLSHEGGREQTGIRIVYICENCGAHSIVTFTPPGHRLELPEVEFGERSVIEKPQPIPPDAAPVPEKPTRRERQSQARASRDASKEVPNPEGTASTPARSENVPAAKPQAQRQKPASREERSKEQQRNQRNNSTTTRQQRPPNNAATASENTSENATRPVRSGVSSSTEQRPRQNRSTHAAAPTATPREDVIQEMSDTIQEQADKAVSKAPPYHRRRRRPFRPPQS